MLFPCEEQSKDGNEWWSGSGLQGGQKNNNNNKYLQDSIDEKIFSSPIHFNETLGHGWKSPKRQMEILK